MNVEDLDVKEGDFIEKYFNEKLKYLLKANAAFSNTIEISQVLNDLILSINYAIINNPKLKEKPVKNIIKIIDRWLKEETSIQIDSFLLRVDGKEINKFLSTIENYSFPSEKKIDDNKIYTIIVETIFCLKSQIVKKANQLRKSFLLFSLIHKLYLAFPKYIENYYKYFIRKYVLREKIGKNKIWKWR